MSRQEITNSQDYKATKAAIEWWYSLPEEQRKATDIDAEPDVVDSYADGVIYGWNHPNWISVEDEPYPPKKNKWDKKSEEVLIYGLWMGRPTRLFGTYHYDTTEWGANGLISNITHWMPLPKPPRKEE
jgi:hypothetical protein